MDDLAFVRRMWDDDHASQGLGMSIDTLDRGRAVVRMPVTADMVNGHGICHGGFIFTLADTAFALVCNSGGELTVASGGEITFLAAAKEGDVLIADGREIASAGRSGLTDVTVRREVGDHVLAEFRGRSRQVGRHSLDG